MTCKYCETELDDDICGVCQEVEETVGEVSPKILFKIISSVSPAALGDNAGLVLALKKIGDSAATIPTPDEHELGDKWAILADGMSVFIGGVVHEALGVVDPTDEEKAAADRCCAWPSTFAHDLSRRCQHDHTMKEIVAKATKDIERDLIKKALDECDHDKQAAAKRLKISLSTLNKKMKEIQSQTDLPLSFGLHMKGDSSGLIPLKEVAERVECSVQTLRNLREQELIPEFKNKNPSRGFGHQIPCLEEKDIVNIKKLLKIKSFSERVDFASHFGWGPGKCPYCLGAGREK